MEWWNDGSTVSGESPVRSFAPIMLASALCALAWPLWASESLIVFAHSGQKLTVSLKSENGPA